MQDTETQHLVKMINQISANLARGEDDKIDAAKVADHLQRFWSPAMRTKLTNYAKNNSNALPKISKMAIAHLQRSVP